MSETDLDYTAEGYYYVETDAYLWQGSSVVQENSESGSSEAVVSLSTSTAFNQSYYITNHWVIPIEGGYCFSCESTGGGGAGQ